MTSHDVTGALSKVSPYSPENCKVPNIADKG